MKVGDKVQTGVYVTGQFVEMGVGIIVRLSDDGASATVDIMSLHGGRPWLVSQPTTHLRPIHESS